LSDHAVAQGADVAPRNREDIHAEKPDVGWSLSQHLLHHVKGVRPLKLVPEQLPAALINRRPLVSFGRRLIVAAFHVVLYPVERRRASDEAQSLLIEIKEDRVADHVPLVVAGDELLRLIDPEIPEAVDSEIREHFESVAALDIQVRHVMGLVEERARLAPRALFVSPVRELGAHHRKGVGSDLRVSQQLYGTAGALQYVFQASVIHN
jgi:hypothetical protein